ncbi:hypothetical protein NQ314_019101 [Rhamnusium bicolor]|uniref:Cytochrome P450 n=1 Tax=Rhamnusium bicolor TaxID=1586634 RepID=A0AAV8WQH5_9CUCU|nr:hypothetical protein NQ314_019101 [Rhamnusium bicolor]
MLHISGKANINRDLTNEDITAQALIFLFAGFDTVSSLMSFTAYELGVNQDIQHRLKKEVDATWKECGGKLTYESLLKMKYMDMVISEAMRKWPNLPQTDRICTKPYTIQPTTPEEEPVHLEKGATVIIPIYPIHRCPKFYPDPDRFDPERFNDENKGNINPYTYMPFGVGPRNCIGSRFALLEVKIIFFSVLKHFEIVPIEKTQIPFEICKKSIFLTAANGFWLGLKRIKN